MRTIHQQHNPNSIHRGVTLIEVLMSLMIMSIGISAVAVLFPISVLRSIQATQLTNGAIVKLNLESKLDARQDLIFDPDGDGNIVEHFRPAANRNYIVDPVGFYTHLADGNGTIAGEFGPGSGVQRFGGNIALANGLTLSGILPGTPSPAQLEAFRLAALDLANQGDGWQTMRDLPPAAWAAGVIQFSSDEDLSDIPSVASALPSDGTGYLVADPGLYRMVLFSEDGNFSQTVPLVAIDTTNNRCYFTEDINGNGVLNAGEDVNVSGTLDDRTLPVEFRVDQDSDGLREPGEEVVSRVIIQSRKISDYSWMLNVRRRGDGLVRNIDVVVKFNDGVSLRDEWLYEAVVVPGSRFVWVRLPSRSNASNDWEPPLRKGGFLFDVANGKWRRIRSIQEAPLFRTGNFVDFDYLVVVDDEIAANEGAGTLASGGPFSSVIVPTGIVDVYPMGSRSLPSSLTSNQF